MNNNYLEELKYQPFAINYLSNCLREGTLVLFLGAGVSKGFGLPAWVDLINLMRKDVNLPEGNFSTADELQNAADEVKRALNNDDFIQLIEKHLYCTIKNLQLVNIFDNHLLISISALLMGSKRGHVTRVVTLNFDSMLEWFLSLFGFVVKTIYKLPDLNGSEDVRIYHPHGFIPHPDLGKISSDFVILGMDSVDERLGTIGDPWFEMTRHILDTGICLFIGMSGKTLSDRGLAPLFNTSGKKVKNERPLGLWILKEELTTSKESEFEAKNIIPLSILDEKDIADFLLKICQQAMQDSIKR